MSKEKKAIKKQKIQFYLDTYHDSSTFKYYYFKKAFCEIYVIEIDGFDTPDDIKKSLLHGAKSDPGLPDESFFKTHAKHYIYITKGFKNE